MRTENHRSESVAAAERRTQRMLQRNLLITLAFAAALYLISGLFGHGMKLEFDNGYLRAVAPDDTAFFIVYEDMTNIELVDAPDYGRCIDGTQKGSCWYGTWSNDAWGTYRLCVHPKVDRCVAVQSASGAYTVINARSNAETDALKNTLDQMKARADEAE